MERTTPTRGKDLIALTRPFAAQDAARSWFHVASTFGVLAAAIALAAAAPWWPLRVLGALLESLVFVRAFILYHDYMHGALLSGSRVARMLFHTQGVLMLTPPRNWSETHNHHHANTARLAASSTGTFSTWSTDTWRAASPLRRLGYVLERHLVTQLFGYVSVFLLSQCLSSFVKDPRRYWSSGLALLVHVALSITLCAVFGPAVYFLTLLGPFLTAYALGTYLFYAQHNFPDVGFRSEDEWTHADSALEASSYLRCGPVMAWFTGNIGYHHVHHLNPRIPFYRLPEAMAAIPELQSPRVTSLHPRDVLACLRLNLWEPALGRMVGYRDVRAQA
ncbi:fatty acid desaturase family protein [Archangium sp.]|uniref:fatty acid desaturase family protein n=1 Tax=Archangium sp. TaxID=1872627 RepID=UPI003899A49F